MYRGAGVAGITAAVSVLHLFGTTAYPRQQALINRSMNDFVIVEYNDYMGGRVAHTTFGQKADGTPYVVELGANWVQGLGSPGGPENPIWTLAKKYNITNTYSNYSSILTYNETGAADYTYLFDNFEEAYEEAEQSAGYILAGNLQDRTARAGLSLAGWKPKLSDSPMAAQAVERFSWDWEYAYTPEESSLLFGTTNYNATFYQFSDENNFVFDQRGFNTFIKGEASTFLKANDTRLLLSTVVTNISYSDHDVTVYTSDGDCISAAYAICTFSLGVLQNEAVTFSPALPLWKQTAISMFEMGTYTKFFLQFNETFWPEDTQFFLYASPTTRGYYPHWQSLSTPDFLPGSNILFVTAVEQESYRIERQSDEQTRNEVMAVLRQMFKDVNVPDPIAFMYPRWSTEPWAYGSYSNWPPATTLEMHQNLRANVGRLWFAGEATSANYFGFLHGALLEGRDAGEKIAALLGCGHGNSSVDGLGRGERLHYAVTGNGTDVLHGTTALDGLSEVNGWDVTSFQTYGLNSEAA